LRKNEFAFVHVWLQKQWSLTQKRLVDS